MYQYGDRVLSLLMLVCDDTCNMLATEDIGQGGKEPPPLDRRGLACLETLV